MEKRNRLHRRGQSPPPDNARVNAARAAAALALTTAIVICVLILTTSLGVSESLLVGIGFSTALLAALAAWLGLRTALVNYEVARLELKAAERRSTFGEEEEDSGG
jgi:hypothetical protein